MDALERIRQEEKELEALMFPKEEGEERERTDSEKEENETSLTEHVDSFDLEEEAPSGATEGGEDDPEEEEDSPEESGSGSQRTSWKKRFTNYKATTDLTLNELRTTVARQNVEIQELRAEIARLKKENYNLSIQLQQKKEDEEDESVDHLFTDNDIDILGQEGIDIMKRVLKAARPKRVNKAEDPVVKSLQERLDQFEKEKVERAKAEAESLRRSDTDRLKARVKSIVPEFEAIDADPSFGEFLKGADEASGLPREHLFRSSISSLDVAGVARFYKEFLALQPRKREDILEERRGPKGSAKSSNTPRKASQEKTYTLQEYSDFMDDVTRGVYLGREKEAKKIEAMFDKAFVEGRII